MVKNKSNDKKSKKRGGGGEEPSLIYHKGKATKQEANRRDDVGNWEGTSKLSTWQKQQEARGALLLADELTVFKCGP